MRAGPNPLHPSHMTPIERRGELCAILATGLFRLRLRLRADDDVAAGREAGDGRTVRLDYAGLRSGRVNDATHRRTA